MAKTQRNSALLAALLAGAVPVLDDKAMRNAIHADEQRRRYARRKRHTGKSTLKYARRPEGWREWIAAKLLKRSFRLKWNVIPVGVRPSVPHVRRDLDAGGDAANAILDAARRAMPSYQFKAVYKPWLVVRDV